MLAITVQNARRSSAVAMLRFNEGFADYQRVLNAQQSLFTQQGRYVTNQSAVVDSFISLYVALGGGWQQRTGTDFVSEETSEVMRERTDWGDLIEEAAAESSMPISDAPIEKSND